MRLRGKSAGSQGARNRKFRLAFTHALASVNRNQRCRVAPRNLKPVHWNPRLSKRRMAQQTRSAVLDAFLRLGAAGPRYSAICADDEHGTANFRRIAARGKAENGLARSSVVICDDTHPSGSRERLADHSMTKLQSCGRLSAADSRNLSIAALTKAGSSTLELCPAPTTQVTDTPVSLDHASS